LYGKTKSCCSCLAETAKEQAKLASIHSMRQVEGRLDLGGVQCQGHVPTMSTVVFARGLNHDADNVDLPVGLPRICASTHVTGTCSQQLLIPKPEHAACKVSCLDMDDRCTAVISVGNNESSFRYESCISTTNRKLDYISSQPDIDSMNQPVHVPNDNHQLRRISVRTRVKSDVVLRCAVRRSTVLDHLSDNAVCVPSTSPLRQPTVHR